MKKFKFYVRINGVVHEIDRFSFEPNGEMYDIDRVVSNLNVHQMAEAMVLNKAS